MTHWSAPYVGLPWHEKGRDQAGVSCWGLVLLAYRERFGIELPPYDDRFACSSEAIEIAAIVAGATASAPWRRVPAEDAREMDVAVLRRCGIDSHVGLIAGPWRMLHIVNGQPSCIVSLRESRWEHRLTAIYRHEALA